jgi:hypothetical protein
MYGFYLFNSRTTDGHPFKSKKLSVPFLYPGVPTGLTPFRGLVPLGRRNRHTLCEGGWTNKRNIKKIKTIHLEHMLYNYIRRSCGMYKFTTNPSFG